MAASPWAGLLPKQAKKAPPPVKLDEQTLAEVERARQMLREAGNPLGSQA